MSTALLSRAPAGVGIDVVLEHISAGEALFSTEVLAGVTPDGLCSTMLDLALAAAAQSVLPPGSGYRRVERTVSQLHTAEPLSGRLTAEARLARRTCGLLVARGEVRDAAGVLRATGRLTARPVQQQH